MKNPINTALERLGLGAPEPVLRPEPVSTPAGSGELSALDLAAALDDPIILIDRNANVAYANSAATRAFGAFNPGGSLFLKFRTPEIRQLVEAARQSRQQANGDYAERVPLERAFKVVVSHLGGLEDLLVLAFKDQSETRRIDRMRADFIANASHELRTPLASVAGFIETLRGPARDDARARDQFLDIMQTQTKRMARLIDDLLSLSRLEMKPRVDASSFVDLGDLLNKVAAGLAPQAQENKVEIVGLHEGDAWLVPGDRDELTQVFENLVENGVKYGRAGGRVELALDRDAHEIRASVRDFGEGIPEDHIPRVTERFYRVDADTSRTQKGTGLGLAIVKHILTRHGGRLSIRSVVGEGSTFTVHLPAKPA